MITMKLVFNFTYLRWKFKLTFWTLVVVLYNVDFGFDNLQFVVSNLECIVCKFSCLCLTFWIWNFGRKYLTIRMVDGYRRLRTFMKMYSSYESQTWRNVFVFAFSSFALLSCGLVCFIIVYVGTSQIGASYICHRVCVFSEITIY